MASLDPIGVLVVEADARFDQRARRLRGVRSVTRDLERRFVYDFPAAGRIRTEDGLGIEGVDDPLAALQWGLLAVDAPAAWSRGVTGRGVRVAVLDTGIDSSHPDLAPNLDLALSTSFIPDEDFDDPPGRHGTHVTGIIAAVANDLGTIGVAPDAEIVAVKVLSARTGSGTFASVLQGIVYAADIGADVINMSLAVRGGMDRREPGVTEILVATQRGINYAHRKGALLVAAAGNDGLDFGGNGALFAYPASFAHVVGVSATAPVGWGVEPTVFLDNLASYSNVGQAVIDFAAPGGDFVYPGDESCSGVPCWVLDMVLSTVPGGWSWMAGTSMASPHVAGVAALAVEAYGRPARPAEVESLLRRAAEDLGKPGRDGLYGHGRADAALPRR